MKRWVWALLALAAVALIGPACGGVDGSGGAEHSIVDGWLVVQESNGWMDVGDEYSFRADGTVVADGQLFTYTYNGSLLVVGPAAFTVDWISDYRLRIIAADGSWVICDRA